MTTDTVIGEPNDTSARPAQMNDVTTVNGYLEASKPRHTGQWPEGMDLDGIIPPRASYTPQFSNSSRALILERISSHPPFSSKDVPNEAEGAPDAPQVETLSLPESSSSPRDVASLRASSTHQRLSLKRKRNNPDSSTATTTTTTTDFTTQATLVLPTPKHAVYPQHYHPSPSSTIQPVKPPPTCSKCHLGGTPGNILVSCAKCPVCLHQLCSTPPVDEFRARDGSFICRECLLSGSGEDGATKKPRRQLAAAQQEDLERMRARRLDMLPEGVVPAKASLVGFKGGDASSAARSQYFSEIQPTDLLNILSLCDQLKPQLLVDLLVSVSKRHPDLPIFDSPDWSSHLPPLPPSSLQRPRVIVKSQLNRSRHGVAAAQGKTKQRSSKAGGGTKKVSKPPTRIREVQVETAQQQQEEEEEEDTLPPTWRKAGQGMYALLPFETDDRKFLVDSNDEEAFSHFMVDKTGHQIIEPV